MGQQQFKETPQEIEIGLVDEASPTFQHGYNQLDDTSLQTTAVTHPSDWESLKQQILNQPYAGLDKLATGAVFGAFSGYAARCALKTTALLLGAGFVSLQVLQYYGYLTVHWSTVQAQIHQTLDLNRDGQVDSQDLDIAKQHLMRMLTMGLPSVTGFGTGFLFGFRGKF